jgi:hypothetical protein
LQPTLEGQLNSRVIIYLTAETVTMDEAIAILKKRGIEVFDVRENPQGL